MFIKTDCVARYRNLWSAVLVSATILIALSCSSSVKSQSAFSYRSPNRLQFPSQVDSNSPLVWLDGTLQLFTSAGFAVRNSGFDVASLANPEPVTLLDEGPAGPFPDGIWIESVYRSPTVPGKLYGWYHHEELYDCTPEILSAPVIGAAVSNDNGISWQNLGLIMTAPPGSSSCSYQNGYFIGGHGDFSVIKQGAYHYIFYTNYALPFAQQGISVARIHEDDLDAPVGSVFKYYNGEWASPGVGGAGTPIWPARVSWEEHEPDCFWGASLHYNYYLDCYVLLMNRAGAYGWTQKGIYYSFNKDLENPTGWSDPVRLNVPADSLRWYPEVVGTAPGETDSYMGATGRLFTSGISNDYVRFFKAGEPVFTINRTALCADMPVMATVTNATPNSVVRLIEEQLIDGEWQFIYDNPNEGRTDVQGQWTFSLNYAREGGGKFRVNRKNGRRKANFVGRYPVADSTSYRAYVEVAGLKSDRVGYELFTNCQVPSFTVSSGVFCPADSVTAMVTDATPNSAVRLIEEQLVDGEWQAVYDNPHAGTTDAQGRWTYPDRYIPGLGYGHYRAYVEVDKFASDYANYELVPCP